MALAATVVLLAGWPSPAAGVTPAGARMTGASPANGTTGVFAIDSDHHTVVFVPAAGGTPRPVTSGLTNPTKIAGSRKGSVYIVDGMRLLKVNAHGVVTTIRTGMAPHADVAVDDNNWLFVLDGTSTVKYSPRDGSAPVAVGTGPAYSDPHHSAAVLTVDAAGDASVTGPDPSDGSDGYTRTVITTFPVRGGAPASRKLIEADNLTDDYFSGSTQVVEARDGTIFLEAVESGASGASDVYRIPPGPAGLAKAYRAMPDYSEYAFTVDVSNEFYLLQNRKWCYGPSRGETCEDDYGVDMVQRYASSGNGRVDTAVTRVDLPVGGISVSSAGAIYGAVLVSIHADLTNNNAVPRLLRINPAGGAAVVLAAGHFLSPVAEDFLWFG